MYQSLQTSTPSTTGYAGQIKTFGEYGPLYQVGTGSRQADNGEWMVEVNLVESGERIEYPLNKLALDPRAK